MDGAVAVVIGAAISGCVGLLVVIVQQRLDRRRDADSSRAAMLAEFSAVGWAATLLISELAQTPVTWKPQIEDSRRFQDGVERVNAKLAQIQLLDAGDVYSSAEVMLAHAEHRSSPARLWLRAGRLRTAAQKQITGQSQLDSSTVLSERRAGRKNRTCLILGNGESAGLTSAWWLGAAVTVEQ